MFEFSSSRSAVDPLEFSWPGALVITPRARSLATRRFSGMPGSGQLHHQRLPFEPPDESRRSTMNTHGEARGSLQGWVNRDLGPHLGHLPSSLFMAGPGKKSGPSFVSVKRPLHGAVLFGKAPPIIPIPLRTSPDDLVHVILL